MRFFDAGQHANGIIAIGQEATGVIAIGQMATGVVAIGQLARGGIAIGQAAFGIWSIGMLSGGLYKAHGMIGAAGNRGVGGILPLLPSLGKRYQVPEAIPFTKIFHEGAEGWIKATLKVEPQGSVALYEGDVVLPVKIHANLFKAARDRVVDRTKNHTLFVFVRRVSGVLVAERLLAEPVPARKRPNFWPLALLQVAGLAALTAGYWVTSASPLIDAVAAAINETPPPNTKAIVPLPPQKKLPKMY